MTHYLKKAKLDDKPVINYIPQFDSFSDVMEKMVIDAANKGLQWGLENAHTNFDYRNGSLYLDIWSQFGDRLFEVELGNKFDQLSIGDNCDYEDYTHIADFFEAYAKGLRAHIAWIEED